VTKERRLGRGLEALLGLAAGRVESPPAGGGLYDGAAEPPQGASPLPDGVPQLQPAAEWAETQPEDHPFPQAPAGQETAAAGGLQRLEVGRIDSNPSQPRQDFDPGEMQSLAESISAHGLLQPVVVRRVEDRYQLIAGERRLRAAREAGWTDVPANVVEADERQMAELAIVENLQRKDLNPLEKAAAFQRYLETYGCTQEELAARLRVDRSTVANLIRLLELPQPVQEDIRQAKITQGHARALLPLGEEREQVEFCRRIQREGLSVRQTETLVQQMIDAADGGPLGVIDREGKASRRPRVHSEHLAALEQELRAALGTKVAITHNARGRGKLVIHFRSHEEFERLRRHLTDARPPEAQTWAG
jgi:ParB family chromosome partitioning protein